MTFFINGLSMLVFVLGIFVSFVLQKVKIVRKVRKEKERKRNMWQSKLASLRRQRLELKNYISKIRRCGGNEQNVKVEKRKVLKLENQIESVKKQLTNHGSEK